MAEYNLRGKAWRFGDNIDTDIIIPARYIPILDIDEQAKHTMEPIDPEFPQKIEKGDFIVAGKNFGYGSSREHAALVLRHVGIGAVIAESFSRIFYRNALNNGLPVIECKEAAQKIKGGDKLEINLGKAEIKNITTGEIFKTSRLPDFLLEIVKKGGLIQYLEEKE